MHKLYGVLTVATIVALCACSGNKNSSSSAASSAAPAQSAGAQTGISTAGSSIYAANCASCHGANGQGAPGVFPPLAANSMVTGDTKKLIHIVKYGLSGKIDVAGKSYNGMMPAWSPQLSDGAISAVLTHIRLSWGNNAGAVTPDEVSAVSK
jgi:mono/diheme cytochrome c family protein